MSASTKIEWTNATINFWWGCTKVGPGCDYCYAEAWDRRTGGAHWGVGVPRRKIASARETMLRLNAKAPDWELSHALYLSSGGKTTSGPLRRVFVQSMSDLFDTEVPCEWFEEAWCTICQCEELDIQIVTKRLPAISKRLDECGFSGWPRHAGLIETVVNQHEADRDIDRLLDLQSRYNIPWVGLSMEPLLGDVDLSRWIDRLDWVIVGGESGPRARDNGFVANARSIMAQCASAQVPFFCKQNVRKAPLPEDLMVREFPQVTA